MKSNELFHFARFHWDGFFQRLGAKTTLHNLGRSRWVEHSFYRFRASFTRYFEKFKDLNWLFANDLKCAFAGKIGGILGVTLGFSIICVVEVFSSFTFGAWRHFHSNIVEEGDDDEADHEMDSVVDYYASSRPRFSAIFRPKRVLENLREKEHTHSTDVDYKVKHVGISPFHLLKGKGY